MFDVFYSGPKPNLFAFERPARNLADAHRQSRTEYYWFIYGGNDYTGFDFDYMPLPWQSQYTHVWPDQHQINGNVYLTNNANNCLHFMPGPAVHRLPVKEYWDIPDYIDPNSIDWRWSPNTLDPPLNYHFPVKWNWENVGGPVYRVPGAEGDKYLYDFVTTTRVDMTNWHVPTNIDRDSFDFSWTPHPREEPYIYKFPTKWNNEGGPEYNVPGAVKEKYMTEQHADTVVDLTNWTVPEEVDQSSVDFSWVPHPKDPPYIYHFGTEYQASVGLTYTVPGATEIKFAGPIPVIGEQTALTELDIFFIDKGNSTSEARFEYLNKNHKVTRVRYANTLFDTIRRCANRTTTAKFWIVSSEYSYEEFDFYWHAEPWQQFMTHVFPSQHNKWSDTFLINRYEFDRHSTWAKSLEEFPNLNFVTNQSVVKTNPTADIYYIDHNNPKSEENLDWLRNIKSRDIIRTRFVGEYLDVLKRIANTAETESVWVISSLCKYTIFDFTWEPEPWQREMIHCWSSNGQKRGDTFYIHVESFRKQMVELELLDWFNVINYVDHPTVERYPTPVHYYQGDDLITEIKNYDFKTPYAVFTNQPDLSLTSSNCLWSKKDRTVVRATRSGATCIVPRDVKQYLKTQLYDYPYLDKYYHINEYYNNKTITGIDIVYISNGEPDEEKWYDTLCYLSNNTGSDIKWIRGVNGRTAAYQAAARASTTPWFFAVFAKIEVDVHFPWREWMPDYWQEPKHYIFNARNPVNDLEYGHQGVIAYNKRLVLENNSPGIDFTLSQPHESVPILSGTAHFNQDPWMTWRTAFREVIKLKHFDATAPTVENTHRLDVWCTCAEGKYAEYCLAGARDAVAYYDEVGGDYEQLKLSFEWQWLQERFKNAI